MSHREPVMQAPRNPLPKGYIPKGAVPYKVTDHDSWAGLAKRHGVDVWWLIKYNFETRDPDIVNWYLKNVTGCRTTTPDGHNWKFSSKDSPGTIYVPAAAVVRAMTTLKFGAYGITIEGDDAFQKSVEATLAFIARSDTGMVLLRAIRGTGKPFTLSAWVGTACNATASPDDMAAATPGGEYILKGDGSFNFRKEPSLIREWLDLPLEPQVGTGAGSSVTVKFTPSMWSISTTGPCAPYAGQPGASGSQVLFHELCHGYREAAGRFYWRPTVGSSSPYDNLEEFFAVVLSNVLTADPTYVATNRTLRSDHWGFTPLAAPQATSKGFVSVVSNRNLMRELIKSEPALVKELAKVKSYFNPFTETI
jgi:hypothetical protein